jgi:hypothetical protein
MAIEIVCERCKGRDVRRDAYAAWNVVSQEWELHAVYDQGYCEDCGGEARLEERDITPHNPLVCPQCGGEEIAYVEDIGNWRRVRALNGSTLVIDGLYSTEGYDDGDNPRLQCRDCVHEWALPADVEMEFV